MGRQWAPRNMRTGVIVCAVCPGNRVTSACTHIPMTSRRRRRMAAKEKKK